MARQPALLRHTRQLASKVVEPTASKFEPSELGGVRNLRPIRIATNISVPANVSGSDETAGAAQSTGSELALSARQPPDDWQKLADKFDRFKENFHFLTDSSLVPEKGARDLQFHRTRFHHSSKKLFASLVSSDTNAALPRVFISHLAVSSLSADSKPTTHPHRLWKVFGIVKFANGRYQLLQSFGTPQPETDLNVILRRSRSLFSFRFDKPFGNCELQRLQSSLRDLLENGTDGVSDFPFNAQDEAADEGRAQVILGKPYAVLLSAMELKAGPSGKHSHPITEGRVLATELSAELQQRSDAFARGWSRRTA